jgi:hypothetical protein
MWKKYYFCCKFPFLRKIKSEKIEIEKFSEFPGKKKVFLIHTCIYFFQKSTTTTTTTKDDTKILYESFKPRAGSTNM